jgi:hypothetical protein|tara:strand:- start:2873 stop:3112 length:240 start_codon:yes stop_codon:yes gene_type:complete
MEVECLFKRNSEEFTLPVLLDRLETVIEVLKERETAVTPELVKAVQIAITWIKNKPVVESALSLDEALDEMINKFFRNI